MGSAISERSVRGVREAASELPARQVRDSSREAAKELDRELNIDELYLDQADFVWRSLQRLGAPQSDLEDLLQDVFVAVQRRRYSYDHSCRITTWLFGFCLRVVKRHRRRGWLRRVRIGSAVPEPVEESTPEQVCQRREARRLADELLDTMKPERRAVFVMFELEGMSTAAIADLMSIPMGTVHSRLRLAREDFRRALARSDSRLRCRGIK